jgi:hypothetical protein
VCIKQLYGTCDGNCIISSLGGCPIMLVGWHAPGGRLRLQVQFVPLLVHRRTKCSMHPYLLNLLMLRYEAFCFVSWYRPATWACRCRGKRSRQWRHCLERLMIFGFHRIACYLDDIWMIFGNSVRLQKGSYIPMHRFAEIQNRSATGTH